MTEISGRRFSISGGQTNSTFLGTPSREFRLASRLSDSAKKMRQLTDEQIEKLKETISNQNQTIENLKESILKEDQSIKDYQFKCYEANHNFSLSVQNRINHFNTDDFEVKSLNCENVRLLNSLNSLFDSNKKENENLKETLKKQIAELEDKRSAINLESFMKDEQYQNLSSEIQNIKNNIKTLEEVIRGKFKSEIDNRKEKIMKLKESINNLKIQISQDKQILSAVPENQIKNPLTEYLEQIILLSNDKDTEIEKLKNEIKSKNKQLQKIQKSNEAAKAKIQIMISQSGLSNV